jgi:hypothetical protein
MIPVPIPAITLIHGENDLIFGSWRLSRAGVQCHRHRIQTLIAKQLLVLSSSLTAFSPPALHFILYFDLKEYQLSSSII